eukprot:scaffold127841_cov28-Tisochrysis_lutea.AAC.10
MVEGAGNQDATHMKSAVCRAPPVPKCCSMSGRRRRSSLTSTKPLRSVSTAAKARRTSGGMGAPTAMSMLADRFFSLTLVTSNGSAGPAFLFSRVTPAAEAPDGAAAGPLATGGPTFLSAFALAQAAGTGAAAASGALSAAAVRLAALLARACAAAAALCCGSLLGVGSAGAVCGCGGWRGATEDEMEGTFVSLLAGGAASALTLPAPSRLLTDGTVSGGGSVGGGPALKEKPPGGGAAPEGLTFAPKGGIGSGTYAEVGFFGCCGGGGGGGRP